MKYLRPHHLPDKAEQAMEKFLKECQANPPANQNLKFPAKVFPKEKEIDQDFGQGAAKETEGGRKLSHENVTSNPSFPSQQYLPALYKPFPPRASNPLSKPGNLNALALIFLPNEVKLHSLPVDFKTQLLKHSTASDSFHEETIHTQPQSNSTIITPKIPKLSHQPNGSEISELEGKQGASWTMIKKAFPPSLWQMCSTPQKHQNRVEVWQ